MRNTRASSSFLGAMPAASAASAAGAASPVDVAARGRDPRGAARDHALVLGVYFGTGIGAAIAVTICSVAYFAEGHS